VLHGEVRREPFAWRASGEGSRTVEFVRVLFHPLHDWVEPGVGVPTTFVDEDWLGWIGHCIDGYNLEVSAMSGPR
jgi:hypothetical protein